MATFLNPWVSELRQDLIEQDTSLDMLHDTVQRMGLSWIESYMEAVFEIQLDNMPAIGDLIKTPSRKKGTAAKRTRANAQADKIKIEKLKLANRPKEDASTDKENAPSPAKAGRVVKNGSAASSASSSSNNPLASGSNNALTTTSSPQLQVSSTTPAAVAPLSPIRAGSSRTNNNTLLHQLQQVQHESPQKELVKPVKGKKKAKNAIEEAEGADEVEEIPAPVKKTKGGKVGKAAAAGGKKKKAKKEKVVELEKPEQEEFLVVEEELGVFVEVPSLGEIELAEEEALAAAASSRLATPTVASAVVEKEEEATVVSQVVPAPIEEGEVAPVVAVAVAPHAIALPSSELSPVEEESPSVVEKKLPPFKSLLVQQPVAPPTIASPPPAVVPEEDTIDRESLPSPEVNSPKIPTPVAASQKPTSAIKTPYLSSTTSTSTWSARAGGSTSIVGLRSSWLSKALGGPDAPEGLRKSQGAALVAASREREKEREEAAIVARASTAASASGPSSTHKRKSGNLDASSTSIEHDQSQTSQYDDHNRRATKLPRVDDHTLPSLPLSTLTSASSIRGALPIMFSPPAPMSAAADNQSGISRLKKEIEDLAAKTARSRALSSIGAPLTAPPIADMRKSLAQRASVIAEGSSSQPTAVVASVPTPAVAPQQLGSSIALPLSPEVEANEEQEEEEQEDDDRVPEPPMPDLATPFRSPVFGLLPPKPITVPAPQMPLSPPPAVKPFTAAQHPAAASEQASSSRAVVQALSKTVREAPVPQPQPVVEYEVSAFPSSPLAAPPVSARQQQVLTPPRQQHVARPQQQQQERVVPAAVSRQQSRSNTPVFDDHHSAALLRQNEILGSTTPSNTPPPRSMVPVASDSSRSRSEQDERELTIEDLVMTGGKGKGRAEEEDLDELADDEGEQVSQPRTTRLTSSLNQSSNSTSALGQSNATSRLGASTSSQSVYAHGASFAAKALGKKSKPEPVKALALAAEAAKKEQGLKDRKAAIARLAEARKNNALVKKREEEKARADEEKRLRNAELAERKAKVAELERKRKEREERERKVKADEEASKKRKLANSTNTNDKVAPEPKRFATSSTNGPPKVISKIAKPVPSSSSSGISNLPPKPVVPSFRHLPPVASTSARPSASSNAAVASGSTIRAVPTTMGPPIRISDMNRQIGQPQQHHRASQMGGGANGQSILQAQRQALQSHIAAQNEETPGLSEAIELPDIKSEYSDSDDEDRNTKTNELPSWAQSPEIRSALREQESHNPDDIFGPMRPLSMEEVFRVRVGKFRARSSSANWGGQDKLTPQEEESYARRMGYKPVLGAAGGVFGGGSGPFGL